MRKDQKTSIDLNKIDCRTKGQNSMFYTSIDLMHDIF